MTDGFACVPPCRYLAIRVRKPIAAREAPAKHNGVDFAACQICSGLCNLGYSSPRLHPRPPHTLPGDIMRTATIVVAASAAALIVNAGIAAEYPAAKEGDWIARDFKFHTGDVMPEVRLHYRTLGAPSGQPVMLLHGTSGSGANMLSNAFAGELFGPGQP